MTRRIKRILASSIAPESAPARDRRVRPWVMVMGWRKLLFAHWPVAPVLLRPHVPDVFHLDTFDGAAWIGVVPFVMSGVRGRLAPPLPTAAEFLELNVRTYVTRNDRPGVYFFSLDTESRLAVVGARQFYRLPYFHAKMRIGPRRGAERSTPSHGDRHETPTSSTAPIHDWLAYESRRIDRRGAAVEFRGRYRPTGQVMDRAAMSELERFLTERFRLYTTSRRGLPLAADVEHAAWPLQRADVEIDMNTMMTPLGDLGLNESEPPLVHYAESIDVVARLITRV